MSRLKKIYALAAFLSLSLLLFACSGKIDQAGKMAKFLPASYNCYITEPSPKALNIFNTCFDSLDESARIQGRRCPACIEFLVRRTLPDAAAGAKAPEERPFAEEKLPYYIQWDQRWAFRRYASGIFGETGCGPTVLSMVYEGLSGKTDKRPDQMAAFAEENGYATKTSGTAWLMMSEGAEKLGLKAKELPLHKPSMLKAMENGQPIILVVGKGDFTSSGHYIILRSYKDSAFQVYDPFSLENSLKNWTYEQLEGQIKNIWAYSY